MANELVELMKELEVSRDATTYIPLADSADYAGHQHAAELAELALNIRDCEDFSVVAYSILIFDELLADGGPNWKG